MQNSYHTQGFIQDFIWRERNEAEGLGRAQLSQTLMGICLFRQLLLLLFDDLQHTKSV